MDFEKALEAGAPAVHEGGNRVGEPDKYERGDVAKGFADADAVVEMTFRTPCEIHTPMEPHGSVAKWDGDRLTVWDTNQGVFDLRSASRSASSCRSATCAWSATTWAAASAASSSRASTR